MSKEEIITNTFEVTNRDLKEDALKQITDPHETLLRFPKAYHERQWTECIHGSRSIQMSTHVSPWK